MGINCSYWVCLLHDPDGPCGRRPTEFLSQGSHVALMLPEFLQECCTRCHFIHYLIPHQSHTNLLAVQVGLVQQDNLVVQNTVDIILERENTRAKSILAYELFVSTEPGSEANASSFKTRCCRDVEIEFLGVWWVSNLLRLNLG